MLSGSESSQGSCSSVEEPLNLVNLASYVTLDGLLHFTYK